MRTRLVVVVASLAVAAIACSSSSKSSTPPTEANAPTTTAPAAKPAQPIIFNGQGNDLAAYSAKPPFTKQIVIHHNDETHPNGLDINGQICFDKQRPGRFVAGEDTFQTTTGHPGWGIFELSGTEIGKLSARQIGKLLPTYQKSNDNPENYGCGFLADGRVVTVDVGNQAAGTEDGQLIVWYPPFESRDVKYCKVDVRLATGQGILVDGDSVYVSQARPPKAGVYRYSASAFPTSNTPSGGCGRKDPTGAPLATNVKRTLFIEPGKGNTLVTPAGIDKSPDGKLYVASVFNGVIAEFKADGTYVRDILQPPKGEQLGAKPFSTGTPLGIGLAPDGSVFYADIGIVVSDKGVGPGDGTGHVRRIAFDAAGNPQPPEIMDSNLAFPDGIGILD
jgi:hypothetical protein